VAFFFGGPVRVLFLAFVFRLALVVVFFFVAM
jgi:hypothetical protein